MGYTEAHGAHRPVFQGRCLVVHAGSANCMPWSFLLFTPPVLTWLVAVAGELGSPALAVACCALFASTVGSLLMAHLKEPGVLPTKVVDVRNTGGTTVRVMRDPRVQQPRPYWPCISSDTSPGADRYQPRKVVLGGEEHELEDFRAKVCRETECCVENFDHFCPWVGNAIGRRNYGWFVVFITSVSLLAAFVAATSGWLVVRAGNQLNPCAAIGAANNGTGRHEGRHESGCHHNGFAHLVTGVADEPVSTALAIYAGMLFFGPFGLFSYHMTLICKGQTTNEQLKAARRRSDGLASRAAGESLWAGCMGNCLMFWRTERQKSHVSDGVDTGCWPSAATRGSGGFELPLVVN